MHENLDKLDKFDADVYAISHDRPSELKQLTDALDERYDKRVDFLSDPDFKLIEAMDMRNDETAFRGFGLIDKNGEMIFHEIDDYWGEQFDETLNRLEKEYEKVK